MPSRIDSQFWMKLAAEKAGIEALIKIAKAGEGIGVRMKKPRRRIAIQYPDRDKGLAYNLQQARNRGFTQAIEEYDQWVLGELEKIPCTQECIDKPFSIGNKDGRVMAYEIVLTRINTLIQRIKES